MPNCKACDYEIAYVTTRAGKQLPVDSLPWVVGVRVKKRTAQSVPIVTLGGSVFWGEVVATAPDIYGASQLARLVDDYVIGRLNHAATCTADKRRRERGALTHQ